MNFNTLVLSGGSIKGIITLGLLQYFFDNSVLNIQNIHTFAGTSIGSIICYLLSIGYTPIEILVYISNNSIFEKNYSFSILNMLQGTGAYNFSYIQEHLEKMTIDKIGKTITLHDLYIKYGKKLICTTYNLTDKKIEYISYENYPDIPCITALHMSSNLPLIFEDFKYMNKYYTDGGIADNFPITIVDKENGENNITLGLILDSYSGMKYTNINTNDLMFLEKLYFILQIPSKTLEDYKINNCTKNCKIINIETKDLKFFNLNLSHKEKLELFSYGYVYGKNCKIEN